MRTLIGNLRYSLRMLRKNPGLTAAVIATLMLGIGATTAIYTVVYAVLLAPLPYPEPNQLMMVWSKVNGHNNGISAGDFLDWKEQSESFQQLAAWTGGSLMFPPRSSLRRSGACVARPVVQYAGDAVSDGTRFPCRRRDTRQRPGCYFDAQIVEPAGRQSKHSRPTAAPQRRTLYGGGSVGAGNRGPF